MRLQRHKQFAQRHVERFRNPIPGQQRPVCGGRAVLAPRLAILECDEGGAAHPGTRGQLVITPAAVPPKLGKPQTQRREVGFR